MYLKRLELQGFKSFADKTVLEFMPGITTVIGPNGSGKSNISDAIRWVLGEQSLKSLRGAKSEDVIFNGTQNRKSLGFAEASIIIDNSDGKLPIEYQEVRITRKIYRSGETGYFINKTPCRLKDISELFMDTGIGKDGYSIIGQGKIDEILSNKSEDRRRIFEEASGIVKYRVRKIESEKKLEQTKLNLLRVNDILTEIEGNIEPLKIQSEKAKSFLNLREELKSIEVGLFLYNIDLYKKKLDQIVIDSQALNNSKEQQEEKHQELILLKQSLKDEIDGITLEIENVQNLGFECSNKIEKINSEIKVSNQIISNNRENYHRYEKEIQELENRVSELNLEKEQKLDKKTNLFSNKEKFEKELQTKQQELNKLITSLSDKELQIEQEKKKMELSIDLKYEKVAYINAQDINFENLVKREKVVKFEVETNISELDEARILKQDISKTFYEIDAKRNEINKSLEDINKKKAESIHKLKEYDEQINKLNYEIRMKDSRYKFLVETEREKEGYIKSVKSLLLECQKDSNLSKGMHGVLANIISVPKQYETAIEMCLGQSLQNIVTSTEQDAKRLIEHLRKNNLGRVSFLPLSSVKGRKIDKIIKNGLNGVIGIASDLINHNSKYEQIVFNLLGRTVIVDNMDTAVMLAKQNNYSFKIVTQLGDVINPSGLITGGSVAQKTVNILGRAREIESLEVELKSLNIKLQELVNNKQEYSEAIQKTLDESTNLEKDLQDTEIIYATEKQRFLAVEENVNKLEVKIGKLKEELSLIDSQKQQIIELKQRAQQEVLDLEKQIEQLSDVIAEFATLNKDNQTYIDNLNLDITNLKISVSSFDESESSIDEIIERFNLDIEICNKSIKNKHTGKENILNENNSLELKIEQLNLEVMEIKELVNSSTPKIEELKNKRLEKNTTLNSTEKMILEQQKSLTLLTEQIIKIDVKKAKIKQDLEEIVNNMWEEYEITPNNTGNYKRTENVQETTKKVNNIRKQIKDLGDINISSIDEYKKTKDRYDFICEQRLDLENTISKLRKIIADMTTIMKDQFTKQFEIINRNFNEVFKELFNGGKAELILQDKDNVLESGIDVEVQPPGKKLQNMMLLSGGEKAFTAIALLFSILKINPAPFCVLDEIEAALDDVNVYKFADYLKKYIDNTQFLVITHRKGTMQAADTVYGITMEENGISKLLSMKLK